ncbi:MAG TPA: hypothetical protein DEG17_00495 [Cyanobacteria bacterium UBA11149]|nr:hypothetical protein [Cyanobacteria bacterium UBA11367]HBE59292.1 hypothetical protein [Cyanobacteria bacterium UBA11366]HBK64839.1 hypothetical protein [Cyanobacteria bacterium UBA11166]HBR74358.1 hypothetical protein [Cyanobacteria bacterium UBA11159]HBS68792.1 hypothetical protein [Cyanobacteria bacterium UBA11153]HBW87397.1 hypothetical protein [Cyanobacteria bacterium UBA11149]HCA96098.1 hypothetical protein [Cyanobacteria bacterium UBA9226]
MSYYILSTHAETDHSQYFSLTTDLAIVYFQDDLSPLYNATATMIFDALMAARSDEALEEVRINYHGNIRTIFAGSDIDNYLIWDGNWVSRKGIFRVGVRDPGTPVGPNPVHLSSKIPSVTPGITRLYWLACR